MISLLLEFLDFFFCCSGCVLLNETRLILTLGHVHNSITDPKSMYLYYVVDIWALKLLHRNPFKAQEGIRYGYMDPFGETDRLVAHGEWRKNGLGFRV